MQSWLLGVTGNCRRSRRDIREVVSCNVRSLTYNWWTTPLLVSRVGLVVGLVVFASDYEPGGIVA